MHGLKFVLLQTRLNIAVFRSNIKRFTAKPVSLCRPQIYPAGSLFNHSCSPSASVTFDGSGRLVATANTPGLKPGDEVRRQGSS